MAFIPITYYDVQCDTDRCSESFEELITKSETTDWPTNLFPAFRRHLSSDGWMITAEHTLCPSHAPAAEASALAAIEASLDQFEIESSHDPLFPLESTDG
ncbi:hypothetical protein NE857_31470 [Nocardiopsis exhalans]|uniref:Uncharacterized protein n=1 Tax=Nocardiopsis exhalans TaxID=163604 RepID=A0ABY5D5R6_9ACTN|nr:hypothetical protein [Nocardiopsis exhalans]USY19699.1 hypothetical protein NE857_31470 [Nocardiopsis exhalans]